MLRDVGVVVRGGCGGLEDEVHGQIKNIGPSKKFDVGKSRELTLICSPSGDCCLMPTVSFVRHSRISESFYRTLESWLTL